MPPRNRRHIAMTINSDIKSLLALLELQEEREAQRKNQRRAVVKAAELQRASNEELRLPPEFLRFRRTT